MNSVVWLLVLSWFTSCVGFYEKNPYSSAYAIYIFRLARTNNIWDEFHFSDSIPGSSAVDYYADTLLNTHPVFVNTAMGYGMGCGGSLVTTASPELSFIPSSTFSVLFWIYPSSTGQVMEVYDATTTSTVYYALWYDSVYQRLTAS